MDIILNNINEYYKINFKTIVYTVFIRVLGNSAINSLVNICLPIFLSLLLEVPVEKRNEKFTTYVLIILFAIIIINILFYIANYIKNKNEKWKNLLDSVTKHISAIHIETANSIFRMHKHTRKSIDCNEFVDKTHFNQIADFQEMSFLVCKSIYDIINNEIGCEDCQVTVYQKFLKSDGKKYDTVKMIAYATKDSIIPSTYESTYNINKHAPDTAFMKLFKRTEIDTIIYHSHKCVQENFILLQGSEKREKDICQYIGIPIKTNTNNVVCVLQIDVSKKKILGKNYKEIKIFADNILKPFSSILYNAYERDGVFNTLYEVWLNSLQK